VPRKKRDGGTEQSKRFRDKVRQQMDDVRGSPGGAEDDIDRLISENVKRHGA
jgi:hypothetical protein